jgi:hypothetical protein
MGELILNFAEIYLDWCEAGHQCAGKLDRQVYAHHHQEEVESSGNTLPPEVLDNLSECVCVT